MLSIGALLFAALPANSPQTGSYGLQSYGFGSGGTANSSTATYSLEGQTGDFTGQTARNGSVDAVGPGYTVDQQASVPKFVSVDNGSSPLFYYNKLHFIIDNTEGGAAPRPSDTKYLITVSSSPAIDATTHEFTTSPLYLKPDGTLTPTFSLTYYQAYAAFGGSSGSTVIGLSQNQSYSFHMKATQGAFTESGYGPVVTQATAPASITFSLASNTVTIPPLAPAAVTSGSQTISTTLSTNGTSGGNVYVGSLNGGLKSGSTGYKIATVTNDLSSISEGFGAQGSIGTVGSGGPYTVVAPYNVSTNNVGGIGTTVSSLYTSSAPIFTANGILTLLAKAASTDIAAKDYQEILTFTASANF
jgi:hypothetical protein